MASWGLWDVVDVAGGAAFAAGRRAYVDRTERTQLPPDSSRSEQALNFGLWDAVGGPIGGQVLRGTENLATGVGEGLTTVGKAAGAGIPILVIVGGVLVVVWALNR